MPKRQTFKLPPLNLEKESLGQRIARLRKTKGFTQVDLAKELVQGEPPEREGHNIRVLISDYERNKIRPNYEMIIRLSKALDVTSDELLGIKPSKKKNGASSLKIQRRMNKIQELPPGQQKALLKTIDTFIEHVQFKNQLS